MKANNLKAGTKVAMLKADRGEIQVTTILLCNVTREELREGLQQDYDVVWFDDEEMPERATLLIEASQRNHQAVKKSYLYN